MRPSDGVGSHTNPDQQIAWMRPVAGPPPASDIARIAESARGFRGSDQDRSLRQISMRASAGEVRGPVFLPGFDGENIGWAGVFLDDLSFDDGFQVLGFPVGGSFGEQGVEIDGVV